MKYTGRNQKVSEIQDSHGRKQLKSYVYLSQHYEQRDMNQKLLRSIDELEYTGVRGNELDNFTQEIPEECPKMGKKCFNELCNHVVFEFSGDVCAPPLKELTPLEKSQDVYKRYVEKSIKLKDQILYGQRFFILFFITEYIFSYVFFSTKRFKKSLYPQKIITNNYYK